MAETETLYETKNGFKSAKELGTRSEENDGMNIIQTSMVELPKLLAEEVYDKANGTIFACWDGEKITYLGQIERNDVTYVPILDDAVLEGAVLLPSAAVEYYNIEELAEDLKQHIYRYLDVSDEFRQFATWYILLSWVYDKVDTLPYLRALGDTGTGKSRFLDVIGRLCYKPCIVSGAITPAPVYRLIKRWRGSLILDEADFKDSDEKHEVIKILNCGFERGRPVIRCEKDNPDELQFLPTYGPKVLATRYPFYDPALESRCLTEVMQQTQREDIPPLLTRQFFEEERELRNKLLMFRFKARDKIDTAAAENIDLGNIEPRLKQATANFAALFANIEPLMKDFRTFLERYNRELVEERANTLTGMVVSALFQLQEGGREVSAKDIADLLREEYGERDAKPQTVGRVFKALKIRVEQKRADGKVRRYVVWDEALMSALKQRYMPEICSIVASVATPKGVQADNATSISSHTLPTPGTPYTNAANATVATGNRIEQFLAPVCEKVPIKASRNATKPNKIDLNADGKRPRYLPIEFMADHPAICYPDPENESKVKEFGPWVRGQIDALPSQLAMSLERKGITKIVGGT